MTGSVRGLADPRDPQYQHKPAEKHDTNTNPDADL
jgi:hypothetical protein